MSCLFVALTVTSRGQKKNYILDNVTFTPLNRNSDCVFWSLRKQSLLKPGSRGREEQGGRRVLLRTDFARAASRTPSPQGRDFAPPSPSTSPRRGASAPASSQGRPRLPAREPAARPQVPSVASGPGSPRAHLAHGHPRLTEPRHLRLAAQTRDACAARSARVHGGTAAAPLGKRRQLPASSAGGPTRTALHRERWEGPGNYFF